MLLKLDETSITPEHGVYVVPWEPNAQGERCIAWLKSSGNPIVRLNGCVFGWLHGSMVTKARQDTSASAM